MKNQNMTRWSHLLPIAVVRRKRGSLSWQDSKVGVTEVGEILRRGGKIRVFKISGVTRLEPV